MSKCVIVTIRTDNNDTPEQIATVVRYVLGEIDAGISVEVMDNDK